MKNFYFTLDCHLTISAHVSNVARTCCIELRRLLSIRRFLTSTAVATLVSVLFCHELTTVTYCCLVLLMIIIIIIIMVIFKCYFSGELIALS